MSIPHLNLIVIQDRATDRSWYRGEAYYHDGYVRQVSQRGQSLTALVSGSTQYQIKIDFNSRGLDTTSCSCPYNYGGDCKHIVATLLFCLYKPEQIRTLPSLEDILECLGQEQTLSLIQQLVAAKPELFDEVEAIAERLTSTVIVEDAPEIEAVNPSAIRSQVKEIVKNSVRHNEWGEEEEIASRSICSLIRDAQIHTQKGQSEQAIAMLTAITESCIENWDEVDDYDLDNYEVATTLNEVWCETILSAELEEADKTDLAASLEIWRDAWGEYFLPAITALEQGWDDPQLQQVLAGNLSSLGLWSGDTPDYAYDLACIRLRILERQSRFSEYLHLAEAEGQIVKYLTMLVRLNRIKEAMQAAKQSLSTTEEVLAFSQCLVDVQNARSEALAIAKQSLNLPGVRGYDLANWTCELAIELNDFATTIEAKTKAFLDSPNFADYLQLAKLAGDSWSQLKSELLTALAKDDSWYAAQAKVDIYLHEKMIKKAISVIDELGYYSDRSFARVMDAAISTYPNWVIKNASARARTIIDAGRADCYEEAIDWLKKVRAAYLASDREQAWLDYRTNLVTIHSRKWKLMGLMESVV